MKHVETIENFPEECENQKQFFLTAKMEDAIQHRGNCLVASGLGQQQQSTIVHQVVNKRTLLVGGDWKMFLFFHILGGETTNQIGNINIY